MPSTLLHLERSTDRTLSAPRPAKRSYALATSQLQQSLHRRHFRQRWFSHVSFVQATQMSFDGSPQMLQENTN